MRDMMKIKHAAVGIYIFTMASAGVVLADCPHNLPEKLLEDCLIYDSEGQTFPADDYAYMDEYQAWLKTQQPEAQTKTPQNMATKMTAASKVNN
jgi:hypothetical protein